MMNAGTLHRRLEKLEVVLNVLSTGDKWSIVHKRALELMSNQSATANSEGAFWMAMSDGTVRFTIPEMDLLLVEARNVSGEEWLPIMH
jgi:hypothetical protein